MKRNPLDHNEYVAETPNDFIGYVVIPPADVISDDGRLVRVRLKRDIKGGKIITVICAKSILPIDSIHLTWKGDRAKE